MQQSKKGTALLLQSTCVMVKSTAENVYSYVKAGNKTRQEVQGSVGSQHKVSMVTTNKYCWLLTVWCYDILGVAGADFSYYYEMDNDGELR